MPSRFLTLDGVAEVLSVSRSQAYALVRRGELRAIKVGGRGVWRIERVELEAFIAAAYVPTRARGIQPGAGLGDRGGDSDVGATEGEEPGGGAGSP